MKPLPAVPAIAEVDGSFSDEDLWRQVLDDIEPEEPIELAKPRSEYPGGRYPSEEANEKLTRGIAKSADRLKHGKTESLHLLDGDGNVVGEFGGEKEHVFVSEKMSKAMDRPGANLTVVHNHPGRGESLSDDDWDGSASPGVREVIAVTADGSMYRGKATAKNVGREWKRRQSQVEEYVWNHGVDDRIASSFYQHVINEVLHEEGKLSYHAQFGRPTQRLFDQHRAAIDGMKTAARKKDLMTYRDKLLELAKPRSEYPGGRYPSEGEDEDRPPPADPKEDQRFFVFEHTQRRGDVVNQMLRDGDRLDTDAKDHIKAVEAAMRPTPKPIVVHRLISGEFAAKLRDRSPGFTFTDKGFVSTSKGDAGLVAYAKQRPWEERFSKSKAGLAKAAAKGAITRIELQVPKGTPHLEPTKVVGNGRVRDPVDGVTSKPSWSTSFDEVLLGRGLKFELVKSDPKTGTLVLKVKK